MNRFFTLLLCVNFSFAFSQPSLNSSNFPLAGVSYNRFISIGGFVGNAGASQFYDFTNTFIWMNDTVRYISPSATPYASFHPGASVASVQPGAITQITYYSSDANAFWASGATLIGDFGMGFTITHANYPLPYTDTLVSNQYTYGHIETEISGIRFVNIYPGIDYQTISGKYIVCDGYGTLYAPLDTFTNVLRVKYVEYKYDTAYSNNVPIDAKTDTLYYYKYFAQNIRHPVLIAHTDKFDQVQYIEALVMPDVLNGCTDSLAQNFNPIANQNDGSCIYCNQISYSISADTSICAGDTITLNATGATNFLWSTSDTVSPILVSPDSTQTFSVYMNYQSYCWQIGAVTVSVYDDALAGFWADMTNPIDGDTILFVNTSTNATNYFWDFGDSTTSTEENPRHLYASAGTKTITLIASNACSSDTLIMTIVFSGVEDFLSSDFMLQVYPNPSNGKFTVYSLQFTVGEHYQLEIYNLLGELVLQQTVNHKQETVNLSGANGIYFVRMKAGDVFYQKKIVKM
ncbi:MAG: T9SS type A sorting domain-containing protein [Bacteroidetes bacterium]|nr:T9SS type A sorting domain-containing protein [Bacteroidota bacterium]